MNVSTPEPFRFFTRLSLTVMTGVRAKDLTEFLTHLKIVPESVIYYHTHRFLQQHQFLVPEPPNDFAYWVTNILQEEPLGERLASIDTVQFNSLDELRRALVSVIEEYSKNNGRHRVNDGREFHFMRAIRFSLPTQYIARNLAEFAESLKKVSASSLYLHVFEAKLRPPLGVNDFSYWFENHLGEQALAKRVASLDPYTHTMEGLRCKILGFIKQRVEELSK